MAEYDPVNELVRLISRAPAPVPETDKFGTPLDPKVETRVGRYAPLIEKYAKLHDLDPELVRAVVRQESRGNPGARSRTGVRGLMQVTQGTYKAFGDPTLPRTNPEGSIAAGTAYLGHLLDRYNGDVVKALAHYNSGGRAARNPVNARPQGRAYVEKILNINLKRDYAPGKFVNQGYDAGVQYNTGNLEQYDLAPPALGARRKLEL